MIPKGFVKISISKKTDAELMRAKRQMQNEYPDEEISYNKLVHWLCESLMGKTY